MTRDSLVIAEWTGRQAGDGQHPPGPSDLLPRLALTPESLRCRHEVL